MDKGTSITITTDGFKEAIRAMEGMDQKTISSIVAAAMRKGSKPILKDAIENYISMADGSTFSGVARSMGTSFDKAKLQLTLGASKRRDKAANLAHLFNSGTDQRYTTAGQSTGSMTKKAIGFWDNANTKNINAVESLMGNEIMDSLERYFKREAKKTSKGL